MKLESPFLKKISIVSEKVNASAFPFNTLRFLNSDFELTFRTPITFFVGENGSGKSTILEAIAKVCGFHESGGAREHQNYSSSDGTFSELAQTLRPSWLPKVGNGFFFRSESFFNLANYIDETGDLASYYGGKEMHQQSHGESFLALFNNRLRTFGRSIYILDEPETALSPARQLSFLRIIRQWENSGNVQAIIATHSPILLAYPNAQILHFNDSSIEKMLWESLEHVILTRSFLNNPDKILKSIFAEDE